MRSLARPRPSSAADRPVASRLVAVVGLLAWILAGCAGPAPSGDVAVASYPAAFIVESLAGDDLRVVHLGAGDAHHYEPFTRDLDTLRRTPHLVLWSEDLEAWVHHATQSLGGQAPSVFAAIQTPPHENGAPVHGGDNDAQGTATNGHATPTDGHDEEHDPHTWMDPLAMRSSAHAVADFLVTAYPVHADNITSRLSDLDARLDTLHAHMEEQLRSCRHDAIVANHDAYAHLAERYGFHVVSLHGIAPGAEPAPETVQRAIEEIEKRQLSVLFLEEGTDPRIVDSIREETGVEVRVLHTLETRPRGGDYVSQQHENAGLLAQALECA